MKEANPVEVPRKKSPRAPSISLDEALDKALRAYDRERLHAAPTDVVAQNIGYKGANSGSALSSLASLRYFGLLERPKEGLLAVTKDVESFKFAPDEGLKRSLLIGFLRRPQLYVDLLDKYESGLPSDANLKFELIRRGFAPQASEAALAAFKRSVEFAGYFESENGADRSEDAVADPAPRLDTQAPAAISPRLSQASAPIADESDESSDLDRIPVRLPGGRRAWLVIPTPFYAADKSRLKAQIDLLLTEEDEKSEGD